MRSAVDSQGLPRATDMPGAGDLNRRALMLQVAVTFAGVALLALTLFHFPPDQFHFYPPCPIQSLLHLQCPGCGTTRALAALLHGHFREALRLNALTISTLPAVALYLLGWFGRSLRSGRSLPAPAISRPMLGASFLAIGVFTVIRNL